VYVAPKFVYGGTIMSDGKFKTSTSYQGPWWGSASNGSFSSNGSGDVFGGSIAVGYDFHKRFNVPVRTELEYSIFSEAKVSGSGSSFAPGPGTADFGFGVWNMGGFGNTLNNNSMKQYFNIQTLFFNAYYDFHTGTPFTPYLGGGVGLAFINTRATNQGSAMMDITLPGWGPFPGTDPYDSWKTSTGSVTRTNFAWNIGAGVAYNFTENIALDLGYRFVGLGHVQTKTGSAMSMDGWTRAAGGFAVGGAPTSHSFKGETTLYMHQVSLGLRITF